jgi:hypothetical protein
VQRGRGFDATATERRNNSEAWQMIDLLRLAPTGKKCAKVRAIEAPVGG